MSADQRTIRQPRLMDHFGCEFFGEAKTITGNVWWYTQDGKIIPLLPMNPIAKGASVSEQEK